MGLFDKLKEKNAELKKRGDLAQKALNEESITGEDLEFFKEQFHGMTPVEYKQTFEEQRARKEARKQDKKVRNEQAKIERIEKKQNDLEKRKIEEQNNPKKYFKPNKSSQHLEVDTERKLWRIKNSLGLGTIYNFDELLNYDLSTNETVQVKGGVSIGRALVGGALIGSTGAILGGLSGKKKQVSQVKRIDINININGEYRSTRQITIHKGAALKVGSFGYNSAMKTAQKDLALLDLINQTEVSSDANKEYASSTLTDELRDLKSLLDEGILTQEEFNKKKLEILG